MSEKLDLEIDDLPPELTGMADEIMTELSRPAESEEQPAEESVPAPAPAPAEEPPAPKKKKKRAESAAASAEPEAETAEADPVPKKAKKKKAAKPAEAPKQPEEQSADAPEEKKSAKLRVPKAKKEQGPLKKLPWRINRILLVCLGLCLLWGLFNLHPGASSDDKTESSGSVSTAEVVETTRIVEDETSDEEQNDEDGTEPTEGEDGEAADETSEEEEPKVETVTSMHYSINHDATYGETPNPDCYGTVSIDTPEEMEAVIQQARDLGLLGKDEEVVFDPDADFDDWEYVKDIEYYLDETIFVINWKETVDNYVCSFSEVKIADASQLRRKLVGDSYGTASTEYLSDLAAETNAVVAYNADFYAFRDFGIMGYQDTLYQYSDATFLGELKMYNCLDNMFVTHSGDFIFAPQGAVYTEEELQQFMEDNDVCFTISFGPILVEDGKLNESYWTNYYPVGETDSIYCRTGIGQVGELHYLYMSLNDSDQIHGVGWTVKQFAEKMQERGVINAYCMDGGQTSEIYFNGEPYNHIVYGTERAVSDMIYFATALPSDGGEG